MLSKTVLVFFLISALGTVGSAQNKKFKVDMTFYDNETSVVIEDLDLVKSRQLTPLNDNYGNYLFQIEDEENEVVYEGSRSVSFRTVSPPLPGEEGGKSTNLESMDMTLFMDYTLSSQKFKVYEEGELVKEVDMVELICEEESSCTEYCASNNADISVCQEDVGKKDSVVESPVQTRYIIILGLASVIIFLAYYFRNKKKI